MPTDLAQLLHTRKPNHSLPGRFYTDPDAFQLDLEAVFYKQWLFAGCTSEVENPGQYLTLEIGPTSVIVARGNDGELRGFHNTCRHRGFRLCENERGQAKSFVCPYHRWTYRLDGSLAYTPYMPDDFDRATHGLRPVHVRAMSGQIFVSLADTPPDFSHYAELVTPMLAPHGLEHARVAHRDRMVVHGNWKLMMENSRECYHCATQHRDLMRTFLDIYDWSDPAAATEIRAFHERCEAAGLLCAIAEGPEFRASRLPFTHGAISITMDGKPAVARLLGRVPHNDIGSLRWVHYPTVFNHALGDYAVMIQMLPLDPQRTAVTTTWLVNPEAVEGRDYDLENLTRVWLTTNAEDGALVERNQRGVNSAGYLPGPYSPALEAGVIKFVDWYCEQVGHHLAGPRVARIAA